MNAKKGFASMTLEQKKAIAAAGGHAAHAKGNAYKFDSVTAKEAGRKGGRSISQDKEHMATIGQKGGLARSRNIGANRISNLITKYEAMEQEAKATASSA